jgi:hypothetical protein
LIKAKPECDSHRLVQAIWRSIGKMLDEVIKKGLPPEYALN